MAPGRDQNAQTCVVISAGRPAVFGKMRGESTIYRKALVLILGVMGLFMLTSTMAFACTGPDDCPMPTQNCCDAGGTMLSMDVLCSAHPALISPGVTCWNGQPARAGRFHWGIGSRPIFADVKYFNIAS